MAVVEQAPGVLPQDVLLGFAGRCCRPESMEEAGFLGRPGQHVGLPRLPRIRREQRQCCQQLFAGGADGRAQNRDRTGFERDVLLLVPPLETSRPAEVKITAGRQKAHRGGRRLDGRLAMQLRRRAEKAGPGRQKGCYGVVGGDPGKRDVSASARAAQKRLD
jgi:hypothetical protein